MIPISWVTSTEQILLLSQLVFAWMIVQYATYRDPTGAQEIQSQTKWTTRRWQVAVLARSLAPGALIIGLVNIDKSTILLIVVATLMAIVLPIGRAELSRRCCKVGAEWELVLNVGFITISAWIIGVNDLQVTRALFTIPLPEGRIAMLCIALSALVFTGRGGTHVVRGLLDKVGTLPTSAPTIRSTVDAAPLLGGKGHDEGEKAENEHRNADEGKKTEEAVTNTAEVDTLEYNRGRVIGNLERLVLVITVALGAYEALGFLVAAKGLIRIREFEDRGFAEYFLIGTLASVTIAFIVGWTLRMAAIALWPL